MTDKSLSEVIADIEVAAGLATAMKQDVTASILLSVASQIKNALKWHDTRLGQLPAPDDFPVLIKDDFESAFNLPARILVNDGTRADWHSNYPFWRRILEVDA